MAIKPLRHASRFLRDSEGTAPLLVLIDQQRQILRAVHDKLTPPLDNHCLHASLDEGKLTLVTDSPAWASRLRFFCPRLDWRPGLGLWQDRGMPHPRPTTAVNGTGFGGRNESATLVPRHDPTAARCRGRPGRDKPGAGAKASGWKRGGLDPHWLGCRQCFIRPLPASWGARSTPKVISWFLGG